MYLWNRYRVSDIVRFINDTYFFQTFVPPLPVDDGVEDDLIIVEPDDAVDAVVDSGAAAVKSGAAATADGQPNPYLQPTPADHGSPRAQVDTPPDIDPASLPVDPSTSSSRQGRHDSAASSERPSKRRRSRPSSRDNDYDNGDDAGRSHKSRKRSPSGQMHIEVI